MRRHRKGITSVACAAAAISMSCGYGIAQQNAGTSNSSGNARDVPPSEIYGKFFQVPATNIIPGNVNLTWNIPEGTTSQSAERGMRYFEAFNCVGCHAPNGGGGMGPSLSDGKFMFGGTPAQIYLTIVHGRPTGMPAWGTILPDTVIWDLVAYVESISKPPSHEWGHTFSQNSPNVEQVPAEFQSTTNPWQYTQPFQHGSQPPK